MRAAVSGAHDDASVLGHHVAQLPPPARRRRRGYAWMHLSWCATAAQHGGLGSVDARVNRCDDGRRRTLRCDEGRRPVPRTQCDRPVLQASKLGARSAGAVSGYIAGSRQRWPRSRIPRQTAALLASGLTRSAHALRRAGPARI